MFREIKQSYGDGIIANAWTLAQNDINYNFSFFTGMRIIQ
jgi:hypothetical protein